VVGGLPGLHEESNSHRRFTTPERFHQGNTREQVAEVIARGKQSAAKVDADHHIRRGEAMMAQDVSARFGGAIERAARAVKAKC
jgi:hypothetical protein